MARPVIWYLRDFGPAHTPLEERLRADRTAICAIPGIRSVPPYETAEQFFPAPPQWMALSSAIALCETARCGIAFADTSTFQRSLPALTLILNSKVELYDANVPSFTSFMLRYSLRAFYDRLRTDLAAPDDDLSARIKKRNVGRSFSEKGVEARQSKAAKLREQLGPAIEKLKADGACSYQQLANGLMQLGVQAPRGGTQWTPMQVLRIVNH